MGTPQSSSRRTARPDQLPLLPATAQPISFHPPARRSEPAEPAKQRRYSRQLRRGVPRPPPPVDIDAYGLARNLPQARNPRVVSEPQQANEHDRPWPTAPLEPSRKRPLMPLSGALTCR